MEFEEAFLEDAIELDDALAASERYLLTSNGHGYQARLYEGPFDGEVQLVSLQELWHLFDMQLNSGAPIWIGGR